MPSLLDLVAGAHDDHDLLALEHALVAGYCDHHRLRPTPGTASAACVAAADPQLVLQLADADAWSLDALVTAFETLVPAAEAAAYGAVFTPEPITAFMAREACDRAVESGFDLAAATVVDPAVGCGALLVAILRELVARTGQAPHQVASRFTGLDVSPDSLRRAGLLLQLACLSLGDPAAPDPRLRAGDALTGEHPDAHTYTIVIGNPPYVRYQRLPEAQRAALAGKWRTCGPGNFNLYFPFFELAHTLAAPGGVLALITPNGYFTSLSGAPVRTWMTERPRLPRKTHRCAARARDECAASSTGWSPAEKIQGGSRKDRRVVVLDRGCLSTGAQVPQPAAGDCHQGGLRLFEDRPERRRRGGRGGCPCASHSVERGGHDSA